LLHTALGSTRPGPFAIRFPKGAAPETESQPPQLLPIGEWEVRRQGTAALLLATGKMVSVAMDAAALLDADGLPPTVINCRYIKPLDARLESWSRRHPVVLTLEDNVTTGGFGSAVAEALAPMGIPVTVMAVPDAFIPQGTQPELMKQLELDAAGVAARIRRLLREPQAMDAPATPTA
jgi:1-deoxy-D-xylulose-5-phosphate synthase